MKIDTSIIISTYNSPEWLAKVLYGYNNQTYRNFEIVIADDGSKQETIDLVKSIEKEVFYPIIHVWHEDNGFQKSEILNKSITQCTSDYIIMSDGDCIPRQDFVEVHVKEREIGYFLSGGYFMLPMDISHAITKEDIYKANCFNLKWLKKNGLKASFKNNKLTAKGLKSKILNGGQDRELGERLINLGIKSKQIRYSAICIHLDHKRGYKNEASIAKNRAIRDVTKNEKKAWTDFGIVKKA